MKTFSFRAECEHDIAEFRKTLERHGIVAELREEKLLIEFHRGPDWMGDMKVELKTEATLEDLRAAMRDQIDTHVMIQSLRELPLSENDLDRDHSI